MNELHAKFDPRTARSALTALRGGYGSADTATTDALYQKSGIPNRSATPLDQLRRPDAGRQASGQAVHTMGQSAPMHGQVSTIFGGSSARDNNRPAYNLLSHSSGPMQHPSMQMSGGGGGGASTQARQGMAQGGDRRAELHGLLGHASAALGIGPDQLIATILRGGFGPGSGQQ